jgi:hypothetical protein
MNLPTAHLNSTLMGKACSMARSAGLTHGERVLVKTKRLKRKQDIIKAVGHGRQFNFNPFSLSNLFPLSFNPSGRRNSIQVAEETQSKWQKKLNPSGRRNSIQVAEETEFLWLKVKKRCTKA